MENLKGKTRISKHKVKYFTYEKYLSPLNQQDKGFLQENVGNNNDKIFTLFS